MPLRSFSPAEMVLTERRRLERPLLMLIWISICSFSLVEGNLFYLAAASVAVGINLLATMRSKEIYVARLFVNIGVLIATVILLMELFLMNQFELLSLGHYIILIMLCKLFERKNNRDYVQMLLLSLLVMVAAALLTVELWFAAALLVFMGLLCYTAMVFSLKRGLDAAAGAVLASEAGPLAPHQVAWNVIRDWPARSLGRKCAAVLGIVLICTVAGFLFLPRLPKSLSSPLGAPAQVRETGFTGTINLGSPGKVYLSDREVMRVRYPKAPPHDNLGYLRAQTFEMYRGSQWSVVTRQTANMGPAQAMQEPSVIQDISMDPSLAPTLFGGFPMIHATVDNYIDADVRAESDLSWTAACKDLGAKWLHYTVRSWDSPLSAEQKKAIDAIEGPPNFARPSDTVEVPRVVADLAREWCADLLLQRDQRPQERDALDLKIAGRIAGRLKKDYDYSLDFSDADPGRDGVEDFLFHMKHGHCEYFASAMTVMCRCLDVRARMAVGFMFDGENRRGDGSFALRGRDAHAWTEVYTPSSGWVLMDATGSASGTIRDRTVSLGTRLLRFWLDMRVRWNDKVIGYDDQSHYAMMQKLADAARQWMAKLGDAFRSLGQSFTNLLVNGTIDRVLVRFMVLLAAVATVAEGLLVIRFLRRRRQAGLSGPTARLRVSLEFFARLQNLLDRHGPPRSPGETFRQHAHLAAQRLHLPEEVLQELVDLYYELRWGAAAPDSGRLHAALAKVNYLESRLRHPKSKP